MTIAEARLIPAHTDEFDAAVEAMSDACEAGDKEAGKVLAFLLQRNDDAIVAKIHGLRA